MSLSSIRKLVSFDIRDGLRRPAEEMHADGRLTERADRGQPMACIADNDIGKIYKRKA
jgi:hypothetical protein